MIAPVKLYTPGEVAKACGVSRWTVWQWRQKGHLPRGYQVCANSPWMVRESELCKIVEWAKTRPKAGRKARKKTQQGRPTVGSPDTKKKDKENNL